MRPEGKGLSMVTPRNFGRVVVLRMAPSRYTEGCQRASFELLVKNATLLSVTPNSLTGVASYGT